jgi:hypothetical protein
MEQHFQGSVVMGARREELPLSSDWLGPVLLSNPVDELTSAGPLGEHQLTAIVTWLASRQAASSDWLGPVPSTFFPL